MLGPANPAALSQFGFVELLPFRFLVSNGQTLFVEGKHVRALLPAGEIPLAKANTILLMNSHSLLLASQDPVLPPPPFVIVKLMPVFGELFPITAADLTPVQVVQPPPAVALT